MPIQLKELINQTIIIGVVFSPTMQKIGYEAVWSINLDPNIFKRNKANLDYFLLAKNKIIRPAWFSIMQEILRYIWRRQKLNR